MVVGGGAQGPDLFAKFIELAGGPDALVVEVPTAGADSVDLSTVGRGLRAAGAKNVVVYHTTSRAVADADTFVAKIANARGVWFGGAISTSQLISIVSGVLALVLLAVNWNRRAPSVV